MAGDLIWSRSNLTPLTSYCRVGASLSPLRLSSPASITGLFTESRYVQSQIHRQTLTPRRYICPQFFLVILIFLVPPSSSRWWMYLQIFLPSFVLSQLYNWPARASVSRVSAPRVRWNWSHYGDGITATSDPASPLPASCNPQKSILTLYWASPSARSVPIKY